MNAFRRKEIRRAIAMMEEAKEILEQTASEEQEARDNMPDSLQESENASRMEENVTTLEDAASTLSDAIEELTPLV